MISLDQELFSLIRLFNLSKVLNTICPTIEIDVELLSNSKKHIKFVANFWLALTCMLQNFIIYQTLNMCLIKHLKCLTTWPNCRQEMIKDYKHKIPWCSINTYIADYAVWSLLIVGRTVIYSCKFLCHLVFCRKLSHWHSYHVYFFYISSHYTCSYSTKVELVNVSDAHWITFEELEKKLNQCTIL